MNDVMGRRVAVVTGAAGSIGRAICRDLDRRGYTVIAIDVSESGLHELCQSLSGTPLLVAADITIEEEIVHIAELVKKRFGRCDALFNNAAIVVTGNFEDVSLGLLRREQEVNLYAPLMLTHKLFPVLRESGGHVVTICSIGGILPLAESPGYSASKFGLRGLMLSLAQMEPQTGVRISLVNPSAVDTSMLRWEAENNGSPLNFLGEPMEADYIAKIAVEQLRGSALEVDIPASSGWIVRISMLAPRCLLAFLPMLRRRGEAGRRRYLRRARGDTSR